MRHNGELTFPLEHSQLGSYHAELYW